MKYADRVGASNESEQGALGVKKITELALASVADKPVGHDNIGNTITFGNLMGMHFAGPKGIVVGVEKAMDNLAQTVNNYAQIAVDGDNNAPARSRASLEIGRSLQGYAQALAAAADYLPGICGDEGTAPPFNGVSANASELANGITKSIDAQVKATRQAAGAAR